MKLKTFLPVEDYTLVTKLPVATIVARLQNKTHHKKPGFLTPRNNSAYLYEGIITESSFSIRRIIDYGNSFLPVIDGTMSNHTGKTEVRINMHLSTIVKWFMLVFAGLLFISLVVHLILFVNNSPAQSGFTLVSTTGSLLFCGLLPYFAFKKESKISKQFLASLSEGEEINN